MNSNESLPGTSLEALPTQSNEDDDVVQPAEAAAPEEISKRAASLRNEAKKDRAYYDDDEEKEANDIAGMGKLTQYSVAGNAFVPTSNTVAALEPGVYKVALTPQGLPIFLKSAVNTDNLLRLPDSKADEIIAEVQKFWTLKETFNKFGFMHKRGVLMYGPPGGGKTATSELIVAELVRQGGTAFIGSGSPSTLAIGLATLREIEPIRKAIVLLEDIDSLIENYGEAELLSLLDGESSIDNSVWIATTNYPENLDGRVINRPSRFDRVIEIGMPSAASRKMYIESRVPDLTEDDVAKWVKHTDGFSMAHIKELIVSVMCFGSDFKESIDRIGTMFKTPKSDDGKSKVGFGSKK